MIKLDVVEDAATSGLMVGNFSSPCRNVCSLGRVDSLGGESVGRGGGKRQTRA